MSSSFFFKMNKVENLTDPAMASYYSFKTHTHPDFFDQTSLFLLLHPSPFQKKLDHQIVASPAGIAQWGKVRVPPPKQEIVITVIHQWRLYIDFSLVTDAVIHKNKKRPKSTEKEYNLSDRGKSPNSTSKTPLHKKWAPPF
jgi:hypothetical protein